MIEVLEESLWELWHDAAHEFVEQRDGEIQVAMARAINHSFVNEFGSARTEAAHFELHFFGDICYRVGAFPEVSSMIAATASASKRTPSSSAASVKARPASSGLSGPILGKLKRRSA